MTESHMFSVPDVFNKHTGWVNIEAEFGEAFYLLVSPVLRLEIAARLFKPQVEVGKSVEKVDPPRWRVAHHRRHGEQMSRIPLSSGEDA